MEKIESLDKNFAISPDFDISDLELYDARKAPFKIYGLVYPSFEGDNFKRMPADAAKSVSWSVYSLSNHTAGGRLRFKTNSTKVAIFAKMTSVSKASHFSVTATAGFDMYVNNRFAKLFVPPFDIKEGYNSILPIGSGEEKEVHINFPLYSGLISLTIGLDKGASVSAPSEYKYEEPVVYYGSSITQGGCASRPSNTYQEILSRRFNIDYVNLGFSGNAKGEREMAEYISDMKMKAFVYDYDYNATNPEELQATHEPMFKIIREKHPTLPIIMLSAPNTNETELLKKRREIIRQTYKNAVENGDKNVYFIDGCAMMKEYADDNAATVDGCHPTDFGFAIIAKKLGEIFEKLFKN